jgi:prevent-host-death family protein
MARPRDARRGLTRPDLVCHYSIVVVRNLSQAKAKLSALIEQVQKGHEVILAKAGKPVARLIPYRGPALPRTPGSMAGQIWIAPDFDVLPDDMAEVFGIGEPSD